MAVVAADPSAAHRCERLWGLLSSAMVREPSGSLVVLDRPGGAPATLWPYSQVLHAGVLVAERRPDPDLVADLGRGLETYRRGRAYQPVRRPWPGLRFVDDNAWVGLAAAQASALSGTGRPGSAVARRLARWVRRKEVPGGGVRWREWTGGVHACSTGAAGLLALRAASLPGPRQGPEPDDEAVSFARRCAGFLLGPLRLPSGLVADNVRDGRLDPTAWSYNQGLAIGLLTALHQTGDDRALDRARELAGTTVAHFAAQDRLWQQPPCFVGVLGRMLLLLHAVDLDPGWVTFVDDYLDQVWERTAATGFQGSGIGAYDRELTLDLAGLTILTALRASPGHVLARVC